MSIENEDADSRMAIISAAFNLFSEIGYSRTSYSAIAKLSGSGRPLVQYYFPKKEQLAIKLIEELMASIDDALESEGDDPIARMLRMGQVYYTALVSTDGMLCFASDVLADRAITSRIVMLNANWSLPLLGYQGEAVNETRASLQATGGVYELLYRDIVDGCVGDPELYSIQNVASFLVFCKTGMYSEQVDLLREQTMSKKEAETLASKALGKVLGARAS